MADWPSIVSPAPRTISTISKESLGLASSFRGAGTSVTVASSRGWPAANLALYFPVILTTTFTAKKLVRANGSTLTGNVDVGIYAADGTRLVSAGSTAISGSSMPQEWDITDLVMAPGLYYLAASASATTAHIWGTVFEGGAAYKGAQAFAVRQEAAAHPLPATATMTAIATANANQIFYFGAVGGPV